ncbi:hypothetical protein E2562_016035 [Oryza meyeriana var. granulata]|uniref:Uncharacterized protein n=1 Tax=Oryza meyeriana var. granulata TaxID=110450 RepID=A0A6G1ELM8_9ORYZ|nr:hypothetical protein E2562_016035 [Oryza meyeriana var. granulata]
MACSMQVVQMVTTDEVARRHRLGKCTGGVTVVGRRSRLSGLGGGSQQHKHKRQRGGGRGGAYREVVMKVAMEAVDMQRKVSKPMQWSVSLLRMSRAATAEECLAPNSTTTEDGLTPNSIAAQDRLGRDREED